MRSHARVAIVGGGMMGVGLLYHLALEGWTDIVLLEKGELTSGSTWHAAGQCASISGSYNIAKIHRYGHELYPRLEAMTGQYTGWHGCGGIRLATTEAEVDWLRYVLGFARSIGFSMEVVGPDEIRRHNPFVNLDGVIAGGLTLDDGHVDPAGCCNAMAIAARRLGAEIVRGNRVTGIEALPTGEWRVVTEQGAVIAEHVVNAAGCYAREVGAMIGVAVPIINMEHHYLVTEAVPEFLARDAEIPVMRDHWTAGYYRQEQKAGLIGIYEHEAAAEAWAARGGSPDWSASNELFPGDLDRIAFWLERALVRMPIFAKVGIKRVVNGAIPHTPDGSPLLGPAAGVRNAWMCCGSSIGIAQGAGCGKYLAQWMVHGAADINMREFDPRRFGGWADPDYTRGKSFDDYQHMFVLHFPGEERMAARPRRTSPLHDRLRAKGAIHGETAGWERPKWFSPGGAGETPGFRRSNAFPAVAAECRAVRERVGVIDLTGFAKLEVTGPDAGRYLDRVLANRLPRRDGGIGLAHLLTESGRIESELTVTRLAADRWYLASSAAAEIRDLDLLRRGRLPTEAVGVRNVTDAIGVLVLAGPRSRALLAGLTAADLSTAAWPWLTGREIEVAGIPVRALRVGYVGELGWELHAPIGRLAELYDRVWQAGEPLGLADFGLYALNSLRLEKAYRGWGSELTNEITPVEADLMRFVAMGKGDFVGRAGVERALAQPQPTRLVHLGVEAADADPMGGEAVMSGGRCVGIATSGGYGHCVGRSLAFAYVEPALAAPGTRLELLILGETRPAEVLAGALWDPGNARLRA
ncbi:MAG: FAD-dependent oxidoreductase [Dongiaceae bacterium]